MVIGDYICVTLRGGAPWGFNLRQEDGDTYRPFVISQVEEESHAFSAGVQEGDEVVSINGEPCADLTLLRAFALIDTSIDSLQLLLKRYCSDPPEDYESGETFCDQRDSSDDALASTTLHILSATHRTQSPRDPSISESQDEAYFEKLDSDADFHRGPHLLCTELQSPLSDDQHCQESEFKHTEVQRCFSAGEMLELQVSLSEQTLDDGGCTSLGSARGIEGEISNSKTVDEVPASSASQSQSQPHSVREPLGQYGVVLSSVPGQVEVILQQPSGSSEGRGTLNVGGPEVSGSIGSQSEGEGGGGHCDGVPRSFTVSFGIPAEEETAEVDQESDSEGDQDKPNRHHARHSRLRRSESLSEKQVKEAKSKCKRIATLLTAAPPNPNNKGVLMFKKHRQRAKKYTLVSYGTGEDESEDSDEEDEDNKDDKQETHTLAFTLVAPKDSEIEKHLLTNSHCTKGLLTINWDKGLLEIERHLNNQTEMECLPESQGKGALMFAQRRQRMEEISAEHDELRRQGIPVEGVKQIEKKIAEHSYMQSGAEGHAYMDVNMHQQSQQQYQQYQEQQYYKQQESYKEQQSYHQQQQSYQQQQQQQQNYQQQQQYEQQYQQQQHEQQNYQQQMYHQQQGYQEQQQYTANINGNIQHQSSEILSSFTNRTAKPFSVENVVATPYSPVVSGTNQESASQGEQIASRDERIATPAIKTGLLQVAGRRTTGKPMFTFKEAPKVSPSPVLLNLLNRKDRKLGFETGPEEDYLSLGAEACNFLQTPHVKQKIPPPVAPKPMVNPNSLLWSPQIEMNNQDTAQHAQNSVCTPAVAPTIDATPAPEVEPTPAPALEPSPPSAPQEVPASITTEEEQQQTWALSEHESKQQTVQVEAPLENGHLNPTQHPEPATVTTWAPTESQSQQPPTTPWHQSAVQSQEIPSIDSPSQPSWVAQQTSHAHVQSHLATTTWTPQRQPTWSQPEEQAQVQAQAHPSWTSLPQPLVQPPRSQSLDQPQPQPQAQPPWTQSHEQPQLQQMQPTWGQPQEPVQQQAQAPWAQPQRTESPHQPPWVQTPQQKPQVQPPWVREAQPEYQTQPAWVQPPQQQTPQQAWPQVKAPGQPQPPWDLAQSQQPSVNPWNPSPAQSQPPWMHPSQAQPQVQATLNPWTPVPAQAESQLWSQQPPEQGQHTMQSWAEEQNQAPSQPWAQPGPGQPVPQSHWQTPLSRPEPQPPMNTGWPPAPSQPQAPVKVWAPEPKQTPVTVSSLTVNPHPSPKPWQALQNTPESRIPPPPPQRMHSFTIGQRLSSPINPMATTLNPSSAGPAYEMPVVRGKGADMFAKRQSRMEKYVVDSETVQANKESRSASPAASLPNEWKYTPNVRAPPSRAFNPIQSPFYPPAALKQPSPSTPTTKDKKKAKEKQMAPVKQLNVIDVMKHQPYQLSSSLFIYGPAEESSKPPAPKPENLPSNQPIENQPISYEQMAPMQQAGQFNSPYPQEGYGMPMQPMMHDSHYQQNPVNIYAPPNAYQQPAIGLYQQAYNQQYQQAAPPAYHGQSAQSPNPPYPQAPQVSYQPASSPPYLAAPSVPYPQQPQQPQQPQPASSYIAPSFSLAARPESASGSNPVSAPKPKFMAKKSSAQAPGRSYSLTPPVRIPFKGQKSASTASSSNPLTQSSTTPLPRQTSWLEKGHKPLSPWEAASRHPLGLVDEAFSPRILHQSLASNICLAAQRKMLPEPPAEWKSKVSYQASQKKGSQTWGYGQSHSQRRAFVSLTKTPNVITTSADCGDYNSLPKPWQPRRPATEAFSVSPTEYKRPTGKQTYKSVYTSNTWSCRR